VLEIADRFIVKRVFDTLDTWDNFTSSSFSFTDLLSLADLYHMENLRALALHNSQHIDEITEFMATSDYGSLSASFHRSIEE
ncbi:hypothetical protein PFISCL1PPCAC_1764, partial [Pristionchus fissidentatus]